MIILESTKVIVESLPKESFWSSSFVTSIIGSIVGGIAAFSGIKWQMKKQLNLEKRKMSAELEIENLKYQDELLRELYESVSIILRFGYFDNEVLEIINDSELGIATLESHMKVISLRPVIQATVVEGLRIEMLLSNIDTFLITAEVKASISIAEEIKKLIAEILNENAQQKRKIIASIQNK